MSSQDPLYNRHLKGTKVWQYRHRVSLGVISVGGLFGGLIYLSPRSQRFAQWLRDRPTTEPEFISERRIRYFHNLTRTADLIKEDKRVVDDPPFGE